MSLFVRKINRAKWQWNSTGKDDDIPADAITGGCIRTSQNALSVWKVDGKEKLEEAVLALVLAPSREQLDTIDVVAMDPEYLRDKGIEWEESKGQTLVSDLTDSHVDLTRLSYRKVGILAYHIAERIQANDAKRYTVGQLTAIVKKAVQDGRVNLDDIPNETLKKRLGPSQPPSQ